MGSALIKGFVQAELFSPETIGVSEPDPARQSELVREFGISALADNQAAFKAPIILIAVKPQVFPTLVQQLSELASLVRSTDDSTHHDPHDRELSSAPESTPVQESTQLIISIMAGIGLRQLESAFPDQAVIRAMPNTPALVGAGMTALSLGQRVTSEQLDHATQLFQSVGAVLQVSETQMDAVTALAGSGPGYFAVILEALIDGGVRVGLPRPMATQLAIQTVIGTGQLLAQEQMQPALLKDKVTSPGGTTIAGIHVLEQAGIRGTLMQAIEAAYHRSRELGSEKS